VRTVADRHRRQLTITRTVALLTGFPGVPTSKKRKNAENVKIRGREGQRKATRKEMREITNRKK